MVAKIGKMNKRINSTKQGFTGTDYNVVLKDSISMKNPKILITGHPDSGVNYMKFNNCYFWIVDIVSNTDGTSWVVGKLDMLATYKSTVTNSHALVTFGPNPGRNYVDDPRVGPDVPGPRTQVALDSDLDIFSKTGCVIMVCNAATDFTSNATVIYALNYGTFLAFLQAAGSLFMQNINSISDVVSALFNLIMAGTGGGNMLDNIKSLKWVPFTLSSVVNEGSWVGTEEIGIGGYRIDGIPSGMAYMNQSPLCVKHIHTTVDLDWPSDTDGDTHRFLRGPKYNSLTFCHPCGSIEIDTNSLLDQDIIDYNIAINLLDGTYWCKIREANTDSSEILGYAEGSTALDLLALMPSGDTVAGQTFKAMAKIATAAFAPSPEGKTTSTETQTLTDSEGKTSTLTTNKVSTSSSNQGTGIGKNWPNFGAPASGAAGQVSGNVLCLYQTNSFASQFYFQRNTRRPRMCATDTTQYDDFCEKYGYPYNQYKKLGDLSGYVECASVSVEPAGSVLPTDNEIASLNSQLCAGVYIE